MLQSLQGSNKLPIPCKNILYLLKDEIYLQIPFYCDFLQSLQAPLYYVEPYDIKTLHTSLNYYAKYDIALWIETEQVLWLLTTVFPLSWLYSCQPASHTRIFHNLCQQYCSTSHWQWSGQCFTETSNKLSCNPKLVKKLTNKSKQIQVEACYMHHTKRNMLCLVHINNKQLPQDDEAKYLTVNLDRRLK